MKVVLPSYPPFEGFGGLERIWSPSGPTKTKPGIFPDEKIPGSLLAANRFSVKLLLL
jgi:hypothetical protein